MIKKIYIALFICTLPLQLCAESGIYSPQQKRNFANENKTVNQAVTRDISQEALTNNQKAALPSASSDIMIIDPVKMASDWVQAFQTLSDKQVSTSTIFFKLKDHTKIANISDISTLPEGYLLLFTIKTLQGNIYKIIKTSEIDSIQTL